MVYMGVAPQPWGPWELERLMEARPRTVQADSGFTYCVFGHPWAGQEQEGEIMVSWSEGGMRGKVVAVMVKLEQKRWERGCGLGGCVVL